MSQRWVLYDPIKKEQSDELSTEETQFILLRLKTKFINNFLIWRDDWDKWKKLNEYLASEDSPFMSTFGSTPDDGMVSEKPAPLKMKSASEDTISRVRASFSDVTVDEVNFRAVAAKPEEFDPDQIDFNKKTDPKSVNFKKLAESGGSYSTNALDNRYKIELLLIHHKGQMFRTTAKDISLTGTFSDRQIPPEFHDSLFDLIIINNVIKDDEFKRITLKSQIVVTDSKMYIKYVSPTDEEKNALRASLDYYTRAIKKII
jgi:hypothetical protein